MGKKHYLKIRTIPDIELLILDIMMPEMDGMQVVKELRKESQIPIIMLTAKLLIWIRSKDWSLVQMIM